MRERLNITYVDDTIIVLKVYNIVSIINLFYSFCIFVYLYIYYYTKQQNSTLLRFLKNYKSDSCIHISPL